MAAPKWASDLFDQVLADHDATGAARLVWRRAKDQRYSSGSTYMHEHDERVTDNRAVVSAGSDRTNARLVLLHEIAHVLTPHDRGHGREFWIMAWSLYERYAPRVPRKVILASEGQYREGALRVAVELGIRGAKTALVKRRSTPSRHHHQWGPVMDSHYFRSNGVPVRGQTCEGCTAWRSAN